MRLDDDAIVHRIAQRLHRTGGVLTCSGTAALEVAMAVLGIGPGDEVIVPAVASHKVAATALRRGAVPVFVEVDRRLVLTPELVGPALTPRTRCVVAVHQYGLPCDAGRIRMVLPAHAALVEDAAQAWGTRLPSGPVGSAGELTVLSFGATKPVSVGAGGALIGDDPRLVDFVTTNDVRQRLLDAPGLPVPFPAPLLSQLLPAIRAADARRSRRRELVCSLTGGLTSAGYHTVPVVGGSPSHHRWPIWCDDSEHRDRLVTFANRSGIPAQAAHARAVADLPMFAGRSRRIGEPLDASRLAVLSTDATPDTAAKFERTISRAREGT